MSLARIHVRFVLILRLAAAFAWSSCAVSYRSVANWSASSTSATRFLSRRSSHPAVLRSPDAWKAWKARGRAGAGDDSRSRRRARHAASFRRPAGAAPVEDRCAGSVLPSSNSRGYPCASPDKSQAGRPFNRPQAGPRDPFCPAKPQACADPETEYQEIMVRRNTLR